MTGDQNAGQSKADSLIALVGSGAPDMPSIKTLENQPTKGRREQLEEASQLLEIYHALTKDAYAISHFRLQIQDFNRVLHLLAAADDQ